MARSVTYSVVPRTKPGEKNDAPKYYAQAQARGDVNIREMAERIQNSCTVHKSDVYGVAAVKLTCALHYFKRNSRFFLEKLLHIFSAAEISVLTAAYLQKRLTRTYCGYAFVCLCRRSSHVSIGFHRLITTAVAANHQHTST